MGGDASNDDSNIYSPDVSASATQNNSQGKTDCPFTINPTTGPARFLLNTIVLIEQNCSMRLTKK